MGYIMYSLVQFVAIDVEKLNWKKHWTVKLGNLGTWGYVVVQSSIIPSLYNVTYTGGSFPRHVLNWTAVIYGCQILHLGRG